MIATGKKRSTKLYHESFPFSTDLKKVKDVTVTIEDLIQFAQNRADVLTNKLPKVKELSYYCIEEKDR